MRVKSLALTTMFQCLLLVLTNSKPITVAHAFAAVATNSATPVRQFSRSIRDFSLFAIGNPYLLELEQGTIQAAAQQAKTDKANEEEQIAQGPQTLVTQNCLGDDEDMSETNEGEHDNDEARNLMQQIKDAGVAGIISYGLVQIVFWTSSVPLVVAGYSAWTGTLPDLANSDDTTQLGAAFLAFVNLARLAIPLRIGLALSVIPWIQSNVVDKYFKKDKEQRG